MPVDKLGLNTCEAEPQSTISFGLGKHLFQSGVPCTFSKNVSFISTVAGV